MWVGGPGWAFPLSPRVFRKAPSLSPLALAPVTTVRERKMRFRGAEINECDESTHTVGHAIVVWLRFARGASKTHDVTMSSPMAVQHE